MLSVKEVAKELNVHPNTIFKNLQNGKIKGIKIGYVWRISKEEIDKIKSKGF